MDKAAAARLVPLYAPAIRTPEERLEALADGIAPHLPITVLLLGMGADMHTACLFPGADRLAEALATDAPPFCADAGRGGREPRITLTAPVLQRAINIHILITGPEKREALERGAGPGPLEAPVRAVSMAQPFIGRSKVRMSEIWQQLAATYRSDQGDGRILDAVRRRPRARRGLLGPRRTGCSSTIPRPTSTRTRASC